MAPIPPLNLNVTPDTKDSCNKWRCCRAWKCCLGSKCCSGNTTTEERTAALPTPNPPAPRVSTLSSTISDDPPKPYETHSVSEIAAGALKAQRKLSVNSDIHIEAVIVDMKHSPRSDEP